VLSAHPGLRIQPVRAVAGYTERRPGPEPAAVRPRDAHPPTHAPAWLFERGGAVRVRDGGAALGPDRCRMDPRQPPLRALRMGVPGSRQSAWGVVGLPRAGLGRLLGLGPRRELRHYALAGIDGLRPLDHGSATT